MDRDKLLARRAEHEADQAAQHEVIRKAEDQIAQGQAAIARARDYLNAIGGAKHETEYWLELLEAKGPTQ